MGGPRLTFCIEAGAAAANQASYAGPDLIRHTAPSTFQAKEDAEGWLYKQRASVAGEDWTPPAVRPSRAVTFSEYATSWLKMRDLKPATRALYESLLRTHILPAFGDLAFTEITPMHVKKWYAGLDTGPTAKANLRLRAEQRRSFRRYPERGAEGPHLWLRDGRGAVSRAEMGARAERHGDGIWLFPQGAADDPWPNARAARWR